MSVAYNFTNVPAPGSPQQIVGVFRKEEATIELRAAVLDGSGTVTGSLMITSMYHHALASMEQSLGDFLAGEFARIAIAARDRGYDQAKDFLRHWLEVPAR